MPLSQFRSRPGGPSVYRHSWLHGEEACPAVQCCGSCCAKLLWSSSRLGETCGRHLTIYKASLKLAVFVQHERFLLKTLGLEVCRRQIKVFEVEGMIDHRGRNAQDSPAFLLVGLARAFRAFSGLLPAMNRTGAVQLHVVQRASLASCL